MRRYFCCFFSNKISQNVVAVTTNESLCSNHEEDSSGNPGCNSTEQNAIFFNQQSISGSQNVQPIVQAYSDGEAELEFNSYSSEDYFPDYSSNSSDQNEAAHTPRDGISMNSRDRVLFLKREQKRYEDDLEGPTSKADVAKFRRKFHENRRLNRQLQEQYKRIEEDQAHAPSCFS